MTVSDAVSHTESCIISVGTGIQLSEDISVAERIPNQTVQVRYVVGASFHGGTITAVRRINRFTKVTYQISGNIRNRFVFI